ncbi:hypothetical protein DPMN_050589, partial [Dreissena polymorpha]
LVVGMSQKLWLQLMRMGMNFGMIVGTTVSIISMEMISMGTIVGMNKKLQWQMTDYLLEIV